MPIQNRTMGMGFWAEGEGKTVSSVVHHALCELPSSISYERTRLKERP
jgi:hypothetical protein